MATKQKTKTKKTSNTHKKKYSAEKQISMKESGAMQDEIILVIALVVSVLLFLSNFDLSGTVGKWVSSFIFGMIGVEAFILPFIIFFLTAFHLSNLGNRRAGRKILSSFVFFVAMAALIQLISTPFDGETPIYSYYTLSSSGRTGGGIIGGILVMILCGLFDTVATYIILIATMAIAVIVITGKAIFTYLANQSKNSLEERKEYQKLRKEQQEELATITKGADQSRRPPKTFVLDPSDVTANGTQNKQSIQNMLKEKAGEKDSVINLKDRKSKKEKTMEEKELPLLNFHNLFEDEAESIDHSDNDQSFNMGQADIPPYEEELRRKFGNSDLEEDDVTMEVVKNDITTGVEQHEPRIDEKKPAQKIDTTDVEELDIKQVPQQKEYIFPPLNLLMAPKPKVNKGGAADRNLKETAMKLQSTLESFGVHVTITNVSCGPAVTRYELQPEQGVKVSRITALADDIKLNLAAADIRIEAPIPGKAAVGIEVPNKENSMVAFREMLESKEFIEHPSDIAFAVGKDIGGQVVITDIAKMPHLLIAGATGSGKSVCINTLIMSILYKSKPSDVRLIMVDPKVVELNVYNGIPHLLIPVVTDPKKASAALNWAVMEMTERYKKFADVGVRDLKGYNDKISEVAYLNDENYQKLPQIVIIIDELADLMMVAPGEVEDAICRLAQMARAAGLHLIIATQRPSVNVITGLIKANVPSRIAFSVSSAIDSRTIIDGSGAEKLLGKGDMLFFPSGYPKPVRVQGAFISDKEVSSVVEFLKKNNSEAKYSDDIHDRINNAKAGDGAIAGTGDDRDEYFMEAGKFIIEKDKASIGMLQRVYKIGFNRAARIMDQLSDAGVVGPEEGTKPRKVLMSPEQFDEYLDEY
ncbi:MAG: cell division FtsK/SpoIIIE [Herbinix sp.]|jgi:S-DNA-T family DNA segregation ATPase FtsK/SpoIIIE|nr:cell division FtsK/SpoIIIE [Herbinix sp.]